MSRKPIVGLTRLGGETSRGVGRARRLNQLRPAESDGRTGEPAESAELLGPFSSPPPTDRSDSSSLRTGPVCPLSVAIIGGDFLEEASARTRFGDVDDACIGLGVGPDLVEAGLLLFGRILGIRSSAVVVARVGIAGDDTLPGLLNWVALVRRRGTGFVSGEAGGRKRCRLAESDAGESFARSLPLYVVAARPLVAAASRFMGSISSSSTREEAVRLSRVVMTELAPLAALPRPFGSRFPPVAPSSPLRPVTVLLLRMLIRSSSSAVCCAIFLDSNE